MTLRGSLVAWTMALLGALAFAVASPAACSAGGSDGDDDDTGTGLSGTGGGLGGGIVVGGAGGGEACAAETFPGELAPLDLYVMLDSSGSMAEDGKWSSVTNALTTFVTSPDSDGMGVGLQFFPLPPDPPLPAPWTCADSMECGPNGIYGPCADLGCPLQPGVLCCMGGLAPDTSCEVDDYDDAAMPIDVLPGAQSQFSTTLSGADPNGDATPTLFAMQGAVIYATGWAQANPTHLVYIVFATDGIPTGCTGPDQFNPVNTVQATADVAQQAANGSPAVPTFVIGVQGTGDQLDELNQIAQAGGTGQAYIVDAGGNATQDFIDALNEIRELGVCVFQIPQPTGGQELDFDRVNVTLIDPDDPNNNTTVLYVGDEASCDPTTGGWYYDNAAAPTKIILCPATCDTVRSTDWSIQVELGCLTVTR
jgi:hypothetical protein